MNSITLYCVFILNLATTLSLNTLAATPIAEQTTNKTFSTRQSLGFDKQISIWLVEKYITPHSPVVFFNGDSPPENTQLFDETGAELFRTADKSTYEQLVSAFSIKNDAANYLIKTTFDIEINLWMPDELTDSKIVENAFRGLQEDWGRDKVPHSCYKEFFDQLVNLYNEKKNFNNASQLKQNLQCWKNALRNTLENSDAMIPQMPIEELLGHIRFGAKVAFVDVREPDEFAENHIPNAINIQIRDADKAFTNKLKHYDIVVSYCIKDFRGFEMAKKLKNLGIEQSVILNPYGIKGWIESKLPVYQKNKTSEAQAIEQLDKCIKEPSQCSST